MSVGMSARLPETASSRRKAAFGRSGRSVIMQNTARPDVFCDGLQRDREVFSYLQR